MFIEKVGVPLFNKNPMRNFLTNCEQASSNFNVNINNKVWQMRLLYNVWCCIFI